LEECYARIEGWVLETGTKRTNICVSPAFGGICVFMTIYYLLITVYYLYSFFSCVESGRTHKDIRLELAPLSALGRKYFLNRNNILKVIHIFSFYLLYMLSFSR